METSHRIDSEEFCRLLEGQVIDDANQFSEKLQEWEDYYNYHRPHGALSGQTPYERLRQKAQDPLSQAFVNCTAVGTRTARPVTDRSAALESRWTALPNRARSVVGEHPGGLNDTGTDAGSVLTAEFDGRAPPQADGIVR